MPRPFLTLVALLAAFAGSPSLAQTIDGGFFAPPGTMLTVEPGLAPPVEAGPPLPPGPVMEMPPPLADGSYPPAGEMLTSDEPVRLDGEEETPEVSFTDFWGYRTQSGSLDWIIGDELGVFSITSGPYVESGIKQGLMVGTQFHFLDGPDETDMPPRLFDFGIGYQVRDQVGSLRFDLATMVVASSDFEGSAREGIRFPSHAVGYLGINPVTDVVFGIDFLDRDDIHLLPVAGLIVMPRPETRLELVFPRPRALVKLSDESWIYLAGELGGSTWAIERVTGEDDLATYRDLRLSIGIESARHSALEIAYLFQRELEYSSRRGDTQLDEAVMLRVVSRY